MNMKSNLEQQYPNLNKIQSQFQCQNKNILIIGEDCEKIGEEGSERQVNFSSITPQRCIIHPQLECVYFCNSNLCSQKLIPICQECINERHNNHETYEINRIFESLELTYMQQRLHLESEFKKQQNTLGEMESIKKQLIEDLTNNIKQIRTELMSKEDTLEKEDLNFKNEVKRLKLLPHQDLIKYLFSPYKIKNNLNGKRDIIDTTIKVQKQYSQLLQILNNLKYHSEELQKTKSISNKNQCKLYYRWDDKEKETQKSSQLFFSQLKEKNITNQNKSIEITQEDIKNKDQYKLQLLKEMELCKSKVSIDYQFNSQTHQNGYFNQIMNSLKKFQNLESLKLKYVSIDELQLLLQSRLTLHLVTACQYAKQYNLSNLTYLSLDFLLSDEDHMKGILKNTPNLTGIYLRLQQTGTNFKSFMNIFSLFEETNLSEIKLQNLNTRKRSTPQSISQSQSKQMFDLIQSLFKVKKERLKVFELIGIVFNFDSPYSLFDKDDNFPLLNRLQINFKEQRNWQDRQERIFFETKIFEIFPVIKRLFFSQCFSNTKVYQRNQQQERMAKILTILKNFLPFFRKEIIMEIFSFAVPF